MKRATITTTKSTIPVLLITSFRFGHATLRNSDLTSRKYLVNRSQRLGLAFPVTADKVCHILYLAQLPGFSVNRMSLTSLTIFFQLNAIWVVSSVFIGSIISVFALSALKGYANSHSRHLQILEIPLELITF